MTVRMWRVRQGEEFGDLDDKRIVLTPTVKMVSFTQFFKVSFIEV